MKLITFSLNPAFASAVRGTLAPGLAVPGLLFVDRSGRPAEAVDLSPLDYASVLDLIEAGPEALAAARSFAETAPRIAFAAITLHAPIPRPPRIFCIGLNYHSHAAESKMAVQAVPTVFLKLSSTVIGPDVPIVLPRLSSKPDYEAELAVVIGKSSRPAYQIAASEAMSHVFGYTILNDVSARDIQLSTSQWTLGKSFPTFTPLGPAITTAEEVPDPHALDIILTLGGETLQSANTRDLIFKIPALIAYISSITPLEPGDIISTGTPEGVGLGRTPPRWIQPGEEISIRIGSLGELRNPTVAE